MRGLRAKRELAGVSQIALASRARVSRMRYQLFEAGELELRPEEIRAVNQVLQEVIKNRASALTKALLEPTSAEA
jgi:transcriptional regulator with XRE-family HTH domain